MLSNYDFENNYYTSFRSIYTSLYHKSSNIYSPADTARSLLICSRYSPSPEYADTILLIILFSFPVTESYLTLLIMPGLPDFTIFSNLVTELQALLKKLPKSVPLATRQDKICEVFIKIPIPFDPTQDWEVFNRRMDALFSEDLRDAHGRLYHLKRGAFAKQLL